MGKSFYVKGLRDPEDPHHKRMVVALEALMEAGLDLPPKLLAYFQGTARPEAALEVDIPSTKKSEDMSQYFYVRMADIPPEVKVIRFTIDH